MNKYLKFVFILAISASLFGSGYFVAYKTVKKDKEIVERTVFEKIEVDRFWQKTPQRFILSGNSMSPTILDGGVHYGYQIEPIQGDIVSFHCSKPACSNGKSGSGDMTKRLIKIREDGAWWVLGDNRAISHDSEDFGWILPSERSDVWVVKLQ